MIASWQAPLPDGKSSEELLVSFDRGRDMRVLVLPAIFDEANKLRRFTIQTMRSLDARGIDSILPDLPGCNESLVPLEQITIELWRGTVEAAAESFRITHVLTIRAGALLAPENLPGWRYAPVTGPKMLRSMLRARTIAAREAGRSETTERLLELGRITGLTLAGWSIGADMVRDLEAAEPHEVPVQTTIAQSEIDGSGLWLRAEPGEDQQQAEALAAIVASGEDRSA